MKPDAVAGGQAARTLSKGGGRWGERMAGRLAASLGTGRLRIAIALRLLRRPRVRIELFGEDHCRAAYAAFTARHPKFPFVRRKSFGAALRDLGAPESELFAGPRFELLRRKVRRTRRLGYQVRLFEPLDALEAILRVHMSSKLRQGRAIRPEYLDHGKLAAYCVQPGPWYGVFDAQQVLRGYCHLPVVGECCVFSRIMGDVDRLEDGIMYLLVHDAVAAMHRLRERTGQPRWAFYDMVLGGSQGLRDFKHRCGFDLYRVSWHWRGGASR